MTLDELNAVFSKHKNTINHWKNGFCYWHYGAAKTPRLYHFSVNSKNDSIVLYCDKCVNFAKKSELTELDEKEYFMARIFNE